MLTRSGPTKAQAWGFAWKDSIRHVFTAINWRNVSGGEGQGGRDEAGAGGWMKGSATEVWMSMIVLSARRSPSATSPPPFLRTPPCFPLSFWAIVWKCPLNDAKEQTLPPSHFPPPSSPWIMSIISGRWDVVSQRAGLRHFDWIWPAQIRTHPYTDRMAVVSAYV